MESSGTQDMAEYDNVAAHWFYSSSKNQWLPFSSKDVLKLEESFQSRDKFADVFGSRFQADLLNLTLKPIYWESDSKETIINIRRSWWYSAPSNNVQEYVPFSFEQCETLEAAYSNAVELNAWPVSLDLTDLGRVIMENANLLKLLSFDEAGQLRDSADHGDVAKAEHIMIAPNATGTPIKRGFNAEFYAALPQNEADKFDHLVLVVHGIGGFCDLRFRSLPDCVNDMRQLTSRLCLDHSIFGSQSNQSSPLKKQSANSIGAGSDSESTTLVGAIEFLPIQWHSALHKGPSGLNDKLNRISLESCGKIRNFVNETLLDVLFFTSPVYHQIIIENVVSEINRVYSLFRDRHPAFNGRVSLIGHSLGSVIVFDILANQSISTNSTQMLLGPCHLHTEVKLLFEPFIFFALGSPLSMFLTVSGVNSIPKDYALPTCRKVFNIFHPFDPVAYRIEPLIQQADGSDALLPPPPVVLPHHRGRKRLHLEVKDVVTKIGDDIRRRVVGSIQSMAVFFKRTRTFSSSSNLVEQVAADMVSASEESASPSSLLQQDEILSIQPEQTLTNWSSSSAAIFNYGAINSLQRIDYVLQEGPIEVVNPYLFSIASHLCYWQSEDTCLFISKTLYESTTASSLLTNQ